MRENEVETLADLLKAISHPLRLKILCLLQDKEMSAGDIQQAVKTTKANISQHLSILRNQGIIGSRRDANFIYNRIEDNRIIRLVDEMQMLFCTNDKGRK